MFDLIGRTQGSESSMFGHTEVRHVRGSECSGSTQPTLWQMSGIRAPAYANVGFEHVGLVGTS